MPVNVSSLQTQNPAVAPAPVLSPKDRAGLKLAVIVLAAMIAFILFISALIAFANLEASREISRVVTNARSDSLTAGQRDYITLLSAEKKSYREFVMDFSQMILMNLLLPVLTAILGYIFGTRETKSGDGNGS